MPRTAAAPGTTAAAAGKPDRTRTNDTPPTDREPEGGQATQDPAASPTTTNRHAEESESDSHPNVKHLQLLMHPGEELRLATLGNFG